jgi:hypothetical protein
MRNIFKLSVIIFLLFPLSAVDISKEELAKTFQKNCRQKIESGISIGSDNINVCNFVYLNNFPEKSKKQLNQLNNQMSELKKEIASLKKKKSSTVINHNKETTIIQKKEITVIQNVIQEKEIDLSKIEQELQNLRKESILNNKQIETVGKTLTQNYQIQLQEMRKEHQNNLQLIKNSLNKNDGLKKKLKKFKNKMENRIEKVEKETVKIKNETNENSNIIKRYFSNINEHFIGVTIIGANDLKYNSSNELYGGGLKYEGWNSDNHSYIFGSLSYESLKTSLEYKTLAEAKELKEETSKFGTVEIGYRQLFPFDKFSKWTPYGSISGGYIFNNGSLVKGAIGLEYKHKSDKILIELGYSYMEIEDILNEVRFNSLGNAEINRKDNVSLPYLSIKYLWRLD